MCVDRRRLWRHAGNVRYNAGIRAALHAAGASAVHSAAWLTPRSDGGLPLPDPNPPTRLLVDRAIRRRGDRRDRRSGPGATLAHPDDDSPSLDAIVVGAGPNGLAAALTLARAGRSVRVYEAADTIGGGTRTQELTLPGFRHDVCSTILPLTAASPFFRTIDWNAHGVELIHPEAPVAHALDGGRAAVLERSFTATAAGLDGDRRTDDGGAWLRLFGPLVRDARKLSNGTAGSGRSRTAPPAGACPVRAAGAALGGRTGARAGSEGSRRGRCSRALAAHSMVALDRPLSASFGLVLGMYAHAVGWPMIRGGVCRGHRRPGCRAPIPRRRDRHGRTGG